MAPMPEGGRFGGNLSRLYRRVRAEPIGKQLRSGSPVHAAASRVGEAGGAADAWQPPRLARGEMCAGSGCVSLDGVPERQALYFCRRSSAVLQASALPAGRGLVSLPMCLVRVTPIVREELDG